MAMVAERINQEKEMAEWLTIIGRFILRLLLTALLGALALGVLFGVFGLIVSLVDKNSKEGWQITVFGAYLGALLGIGEGIKAFFGVRDEEAITGKELAQEAGKNVAGNLMPGLNFLILLGDAAAWSRRARPARDGGRRALLEAIAWSIIALGMIALIYGILRLDMGSFSIWYALLFVPPAAIFGAIRGSYTTAKTTSRKERDDQDDRNPWT